MVDVVRDPNEVLPGRVDEGEVGFEVAELPSNGGDVVGASSFVIADFISPIAFLTPQEATPMIAVMTV